MEKAHEHHRESDEDLVKYLWRYGKQLAILIGTVSVIVGAMLAIGKTEFVSKSDAAATYEKTQDQLVEQNKAIAQIDKTTGITQEKVINIEKTVNEIKRLVKQ